MTISGFVIVGSDLNSYLALSRSGARSYDSYLFARLSLTLSMRGAEICGMLSLRGDVSPFLTGDLAGGERAVKGFSMKGLGAG